MSNRSNLTSEFMGEEAFVSENLATIGRFELLTSECQVIKETDTLRPNHSATTQDFTALQLHDTSSKVLPQTFESTPDAKMHKTNVLRAKVSHKQEAYSVENIGNQQVELPISILRKRSKMTRYQDYVSHRTRSERRVRFRESDEIIFHTTEDNSYLPAVFWKLLVVISLSLVIVLLHYNENASNMYEQLHSKLISYYLEIKHTTSSWLNRNRRH